MANSACIFFLGILLAACVDSQQNSPDAEAIVTASIASYSLDLVADGQRRWAAVAASMATLNDQVGYFAGNVSLFYNTSADKSAISDLILQPVCAVQPSTTLYTNFTAAQEFFCCQLRRVRPPGVFALYADLYEHYLGVDSVIGLDTTVASTLLLNLIYEKDTTIDGYEISACKDDIRVHVPEQAILSSIGANVRLAPLQDAYSFMSLNLQSLSVCVTTSPSPCLASDLLSSLSISYAIVDHDPLYQRVCSYSVLQSIESARATSTC